MVAPKVKHPRPPVNPDYRLPDGEPDWAKIRREFIQWYFRSGGKLTQQEAADYYGVLYNSFNNHKRHWEWLEKAKQTGWDIKLARPLTPKEQSEYEAFADSIPDMPSITQLGTLKKAAVLKKAANTAPDKRTTQWKNNVQFATELAVTLGLMGDQSFEQDPDEEPQNNLITSDKTGGNNLITPDKNRGNNLITLEDMPLPQLSMENISSSQFWNRYLELPWAKVTADVLKARSKGLSLKGALEARGITEAQWSILKRELPLVDTASKIANRAYELDKLEKIDAKASERWDAAAWLLENSTDTDDRYQKKKSAGGVSITITVDRDAQSKIQVSDDVIDADYFEEE